MMGKQFNMVVFSELNEKGRKLVSEGRMEMISQNETMET
jgi:hypothetical protein